MKNKTVVFSSDGKTYSVSLKCFDSLINTSDFSKDCYDLILGQQSNPYYFVREKEKLCETYESLLNIFENEDYENFFKENAVCKKDSSYDEIAKTLFPFPRIPNESVIKSCVEAVSRNKLTGIIPNIMISGSAGIGKTTLAKSLAKCFKSEDGRTKKVIVCSASSLLGRYIGHTEGRVFNLLKEADETNSIIFIDEAYVLMDNSFGQEAVAMLLPIMTGDRKTIEKVETDRSGIETISRYTFKNNPPPIWISGYDKDLRNMAGTNEGFYRRFTCKIKILAPCPTELYDAMICYARYLPQKLQNFQDEDVGLLEYALNLCRDEILAFFRFATNYENEKIFANYAGMEDFCETCAAMIDTSMNDAQIITKISQIITDKKTEISRQYSIHIGNKEGGLSFRVENDEQGSFDELIGMDAEKAEFSMIIDFMTGQNKYLEMGVRVPKGILLAGAPGCGKTEMARAVAGELRSAFLKNGIDNTVAFIPVSASEIIGSRNPILAVDTLFADASEYDAAVIFIDEIDAIGRGRRNNPYQAVLLELMSKMDGFSRNGNILVIAATNAPETLDEALIRPGRFDKKFTVELPEKEVRKKLIRFFLDRISGLQLSKADKEEFSEEFAEKTSGFSPADLQNIINDSACLNLQVQDVPFKQIAEKFPHRLINVKGKKIPKRTALENFRVDVSETIDRKYIGIMNKAEKEFEFSTEENDGCSATAVHEVGHGLVSLLLGQKPFEKITIIPRGDALGYVEPDRSQIFRTKKQIMNRIRILYGGRIAEELFYGEDNISVGAAQDIREATRLARQVVELFGMSDEFGMMSFGQHEGRFLGNDISYSCSDTYRARADEEINRLLREIYSDTHKLLLDNIDIHRELARFVFERETLTGDEFTKEYERLTSSAEAQRYLY